MTKRLSFKLFDQDCFRRKDRLLHLGETIVAKLFKKILAGKI